MQYFLNAPLRRRKKCPEAGHKKARNRFIRFELFCWRDWVLEKALYDFPVRPPDYLSKRRFPLPVDAFQTIYIPKNFLAKFGSMRIHSSVFRATAFLFLLDHLDLLPLIGIHHILLVRIGAAHCKAFFSLAPQSSA